MPISFKKIKYEIIFEALEGQIECGDQYLIQELADFILIAVVDGLGHGEEAAFAAKKAVETIDANINKPIETIFEICDQVLHNTRGVAMTIATIDSKYELTYVGVGNVMGICWKMDENNKIARDSMFLEGGIVGAREPRSIIVRKIALAPGDTLILATDGINKEVESELPKLESPEKIAQYIFKTFRNKNDDGLVLVAQLQH